MKTVFILVLIVAACICSRVDLGARRLEKTEDSNPSCSGFKNPGKPFVHTANTSTSVERKFSISYPENYNPGLLALMENRMREPLQTFAKKPLNFNTEIKRHLKTYIVAQFVNERGELMASIFMRPTDYTAKDEKGKITCTRKVIEIYSMYVSPSYRGREELSMPLFKEAIEHVLKEKNMDMHETLLALWLSPHYPLMEIAHVFYRNNGFKKAAIVKSLHGYIVEGKELIGLGSPEEVIAKYDPGKKQSDGSSIMMLAEACTFMQIQENSSCTEGDYEKHYETAKKIRDVLEGYRREEETPICSCTNLLKRMGNWMRKWTRKR
jgi:Putative acetyl-transferase